ncbi:hypothetical protein DL89DRAFT_270320 [Linderina pennispora]|uniref:Uncharacterized protein n=1 Tax=Linderina pennispora TaxID=61395 RepID=A0A1Y1VY30_9FUNG|nr:uncharacterized protein DL89DRAFT_270320 [Linderina pennispora]ORX66133.1 hypothetical protein DL89DRAFT_270320 [Linderina pennispora]
MAAGAVSYTMCIVSQWSQRCRASAQGLGIAEMIGELLQVVLGKLDIIMQNIVVRRARRPAQGRVRVQVKVGHAWQGDRMIKAHSGHAVSAAVAIVVDGEEARAIPHHCLSAIPYNSIGNIDPFLHSIPGRSGYWSRML